MVKLISTLVLLLFFTVGNAQNQTNDVFEIARKGNLEEAKKALKKDRKAFNVINNSGFSPLILACYHGNLPMVSFLINNGCDINFKSSMGTALMASIVKGNNDITKELLLKNADVNITDDEGTTALMYAVMFKNKEIVMLLLDKKADKNLIDKKGKTAFEYAVFSGNEDIINLLK